MKLLLTFLISCSFFSLSCFAQTGTTSNNDTIPMDSSGVSALYNRIISLDEEIRNNPGAQANNFNPQDSATLPIGIVKEIGNTIYIICIDSARFTPQGAFFSVYMAMDFPGADRKIAFAAKNIQFNPQGVLLGNGSRLQLVSEQVVALGPKTDLVFKADGQNFIEWDCNGYKQSGLSLDFVFKGDMLINANNPAEPVKAGLQTVINDLNNIVFQIPSITPFKVKGAEDFIFALSNIVIDRSEYSTPSGVTLSPQALLTYNDDINAWKGFYAGNATVTLPNKLSKKNDQTEIYANNLIIDDSGLSGTFGANNVFSTSDGEMNGKWGFSIDNIQVAIANNHLSSGSIAGAIQVPPLDDQSFSYSASVSQNTTTNKLDYAFSVSPDSTISLNAFKSSLELSPSSIFTVVSDNDKFVPSMTLNGSWTVDYSKAKFSGLSFQNLKIVTQSPYITSGTFALVNNPDASDNCIGLPISLNSLAMTLTPQNQLSFDVGIGMNLGDTTSGFGVSTVVKFKTKREPNALGQEKIVFDNFAVNTITLDIHTNAFSLQGVIAILNDDPVFGDLFYGSISLGVGDLFPSPLMASVGFGKMSTYKYWFTDVSIPLPVPIAVVPGFNITTLYGGVQNRVISTQTDQQLLARVAGTISTGANAIPFTPDDTQGLLFRAGVAFSNPKEEVLNGELMLTVAFNPSGGFQSINFMGQAYMMVKRANRSGNDVKKVWGDLSVNYDHSQKVFDAGINAGIIVPNTLTGGLNITLHIDENDWYFWLNRPSNRAYLNLVNIFEINTYFMIGTVIDPIPPPPSYVTNLVGGGSISNIDFNAIGNGNGFATGVQFGVNFNGEFPSSGKWRGYIACNIGGGFDLMMINVENASCSNFPGPIGVNGYYCMGQVYVYMGGSLGIRKYDGSTLKNEWAVGTLQMAALLQGKLPKPAYVYGAVGLQASVLGIINLSFNADIEFGTDCQLTGI
ncbi:hypothetical protein N8927_03270 [Crocinitomicaceae bacterium]|nr:hypothetical protein [Crocinitomicaceae bacterium]